jgi:hypothetical protein
MAGRNCAALHSQRCKNAFGDHVRVGLSAHRLGKIASQPIAGIRIRINPAGRREQEIRLPSVDAIAERGVVVRSEHRRFIVKA